MTSKLTPPPMMNGLPPGANSYRTGSMVSNAQGAHLLNKLNNTSGAGGKRRTKRAGKGVVVSMPQQLYPSVSPQNTTNIIKGGVAQNNQALTNNNFYKNVAPAQPIPEGQLAGTGHKIGGSCGCDWKGGSKRRSRSRRLKGGTRIMGPNTTWGCKSGGRRKRNKTKKYRKTIRKK